MKVLLTGKNTRDIENLVKQLGLKIAKSKPDLIISYGGDGTLLTAERRYPGIPKLPIRDSRFCHKCPKHKDKKILEDLLEGKLILKEYKKLHTNIYGKDLYALNDFIIRNEHPVHAIRFKMHYYINPQLLVGDGIVVSTPFGSTGYFKSVTGETFTDGFAVAFNNLTEKSKPIYTDQDAIDKQDNFTYIEFELVRGKAGLTVDNNPEIFHLSEGIWLKFKLSDQVAKIYEDSSLHCPNCKVQR